MHAKIPSARIEMKINARMLISMRALIFISILALGIFACMKCLCMSLVTQANMPLFK
ncbi:hypothetical protein TH0274_14090 [Helicobacter pylori]